MPLRRAGGNATAVGTAAFASRCQKATRMRKKTKPEDTSLPPSIPPQPAKIVPGKGEPGWDLESIGRQFEDAALGLTLHLKLMPKQRRKDAGAFRLRMTDEQVDIELNPYRIRSQEKLNQVIAQCIASIA